MEYLLMTLVIFGALVLVGYPLANPRRYTARKFVTMSDPQYEQLAGAREQAFDALRDFEFDHATGKLSEADYKTLRARYETRAASIMQQLDTLTAAQNAGGAARAPKRHAKPAPGAERTCQRCHARAAADDRFCMKCGARI